MNSMLNSDQIGMFLQKISDLNKLLNGITVNLKNLPEVMADNEQEIQSLHEFVKKLPETTDDLSTSEAVKQIVDKTLNTLRPWMDTMQEKSELNQKSFQ